MDDVEIFIRLTWSFHHDFHFQIASGRTIRLFSWGKAGVTLNHIKSADEIQELIFKKVELQSNLSSFWVFNVWIYVLVIWSKCWKFLDYTLTVSDKQSSLGWLWCNQRILSWTYWLPSRPSLWVLCIFQTICGMDHVFAPTKKVQNLTGNLVTFWVSNTFHNHHHLTNTTSIVYDSNDSYD